MSKPKIPPIDNEDEVVEWFLRYDDKIKHEFLTDSTIFEKAKNEILDNLREHSDASSLQSFIEKISVAYTEKLLPSIATNHENNEEVPWQLLITEMLFSAKMRILGYFLLKKYGIQPGEGNNFTNPNTMKKSKKTTAKKSNKNAIIGFVLSVASIFGIGLAGIIGMIFGIVALTQIKHTHEQGKGWAIAAIVIGLIWGFGIGILRRVVEMGY